MTTMPGIRALAKACVPASWVRAARTVLRDHGLARSIRRLREAGGLDRPELGAFHAAWGNVGFSCDLHFLDAVQKRLSTARGTVLECGTGATTLLAGVLAERHGFRVLSLEQDPSWSAHVRRTLRREGIDRVTIVEAPLRREGDYAWYDVDPGVVPPDVSLVICDGPFVASSFGPPIHASWRYGVVPHVLARRDAEMLLDDLDDPRAHAVLDRWSREFGAICSPVHSDDGEFGIVRLARVPAARQG
jgi:hypothetical protein